nr:zinc finger, CCHC-type, retrotransposon Gag domain protein [Tanacetum cinerariifolium]
MAWQTDYDIMKEGMSILRGRKSVPGMNSSERENGKKVAVNGENGKKRLLGLDVSYMKAYKQAEGGDAWLVTVTWANFKKLFFLQFFPRAEQERLKRNSGYVGNTSTLGNAGRSSQNTGNDTIVDTFGQGDAIKVINSYGKGDGDLSQSEVGDVDLSSSYCGEKVGLITPSPSTDVKERCISYYHGLDHVEISDGLNSGSYAIPNQRVNTSDIISQKGKVQRNEKATHLKKRKMKTRNLFKLIQIKQRDKLMNDMKKGTPRLWSSKALKLLRQVAL